MSDPSLALQAAIVAALKGSADLTALLAERIYDRVPEAARFPYMSYGEDQVAEADADGGTCLIEGFEVFVTLHVWSRAVGRAEAKRIGGAVRATLHNRALPVSGFALHEFEHISTDYFTDPDGLTTHGVCQFRALIDPA